MIPIVCLDDNMGMMFNHRRQSQDRVLRDYILKLTEGNRLWMNNYSAKQYGDHIPQINVDENFLNEAAPGEYCFVEDKGILPYAQWVEKVIVCKWNRVYPSDMKFDLPSEGWTRTLLSEFAGSSHEKLSIEEWSK